MTGVCDRDAGAAERAAARAGGCAPYTELDAMLADARPDVVHIATPPATHHRLALAVLAAGRHALVEKPLAMTVRQADEMIEAARRAGVRLCVVHNFLFEAGVRRARQLVDAGRLGRLTAVEVFWRVLRGSPAGPRPAWIDELPGGVFQEVAPHAVYLADAFLEGPRVAAVLVRPTTGAIDGEADELRVLLDSESAVGSLAVSVASEPHVVNLRLHGTRRSLAVDLTTSAVVRLRKAGVGNAAKVAAAVDWSLQYLAGTAANASRALVGALPTGRETLIRDFYGSLRDGTAAPVTAEAGRRVVALLDQVWDHFPRAELEEDGG